MDYEPLEVVPLVEALWDFAGSMMESLPGSVSFRIDDSSYNVILDRSDIAETAPVPDVIRAIDVPFEVPFGGVVEIASISEGQLVELTPGSYQLRFECRDADLASRVSAAAGADLSFGLRRFRA